MLCSKTTSRWWWATPSTSRTCRGARPTAWLADLLRHGLIPKSFVPPKPIRELRDLMRYRRKLVESRSSERNRLQNVLELANIKLASFVSDVFGVSGMAMLRALIDGALAPEQMAELARGRMRSKLPDLEQALTGRMQDHHRFLLQMQLDRLTQVEGHIAELEKRIETLLVPYEEPRRLLRTIPGVDATISAILIAEMGVDMGVFKSAGHLASWAGVCPGSDESAGKRRNPKTTPGNRHIKTALAEAA
jgi:transposase